MRRLILAVAFALTIAGGAIAQVWIMSPTGGSPPTGAGGSGTHVPSVCLGAIDLSAGCGLPMLGGAP